LSTITPNVQTSPDLVTWTTVTPGLIKPLSTSGNDTFTEYGVSLNGATRLFIRLQIPSQ
jgi:hypothetical protein